MKSRVVSLLPAATEFVCALGARGRLVGRSHECDFPEAVRALPSLTVPGVDPGATSAAIDVAVKEKDQSGQPLFRIDVDGLRGLRPDLILTQAQCAVCAVSEADLRAAVAGWEDPKPEVLALNPAHFADLWTDFQRVAEALGVPNAGREWIRPYRERVAEVITRVTTGVSRRPTVVALEWLDPLMTGGNWIPELVELAGGTPLLSRPGSHSTWTNWEALAAADPDVLVLMPCGFDLARTRAEAAMLGGRPEWSCLKAVKRGRVHVVDGNALFNRPGPRLVDSLEVLAEILHPALFPARHRGSAWQPL